MGLGVRLGLESGGVPRGTKRQVAAMERMRDCVCGMSTHTTPPKASRTSASLLTRRAMAAEET